MAVLLEEVGGQPGRIGPATPPEDRLQALAGKAGVEEDDLARAVRVFLGEEPFDAELDGDGPGSAAGFLLAWSDVGGRDPAMWRAVARRLAFVAGEGDRGHGATSLRTSSQPHPLLASFRVAAREVLSARELGPVDDRVNALCRSLAREITCIGVEAGMGIGPATLLTATQQEEASRLPRAALEAMGRMLAERGTEVHGTREYSRLEARALAEALKAEGPTATVPPARRSPYRPAWDRAMREIAGALDHLQDLVSRLGLPLRVALVPKGFQVPGGGVPGGDEPPSPRGEDPPLPCGEATYAASGPSPGQPRFLPPTAPVSLLRWASRIRRAFCDLAPFLTPRLREYVPGIV